MICIWSFLLHFVVIYAFFNITLDRRELRQEAEMPRWNRIYSVGWEGYHRKLWLLNHRFRSKTTEVCQNRKKRKLSFNISCRPLPPAPLSCEPALLCRSIFDFLANRAFWSKVIQTKTETSHTLHKRSKTPLIFKNAKCHKLFYHKMQSSNINDSLITYLKLLCNWLSRCRNYKIILKNPRAWNSSRSLVTPRMSLQAIPLISPGCVSDFFRVCFLVRN